MNNKLRIKEADKPDNSPCEHDSRSMIDLLAGEISDKDSKTLSSQLDNCEICRDQLADLSQTWQLTAEVLKSEVSGKETSNIEHPTPNIESNKAEKSKTVKKLNRIQESLKRKNLKKKFAFIKEKADKIMAKRPNMKFAYGEIAASFIVVFIAVLLYGGMNSGRLRSIIAGSASAFGSDDAEDAVSSNSVRILKSLEADGSFDGTDSAPGSESYTADSLL